MVNIKDFDSWIFELTPVNLIDRDNNPLFKFLIPTSVSPDKDFLYSTYQRVFFSVSGYDADSRELFEIPEFVLFCRTLSLQFPFFFYFFPPKLCKLLVMGALEAKSIEKGLGQADPATLETFVERCIENAVEFGIGVGHSEKEMRDIFSQLGNN